MTLLLGTQLIGLAHAATIEVTSTAADRGTFTELMCLPAGSDVDAGPGATTVTGGATLAGAQADGRVTLREAICVANNTPEADIIVLSPATYTLSTADNYWYGPNGLPPIGDDITIEGNGAVIERDPTSNPFVLNERFRLFFISRKTLTDGIAIVGGVDRAKLTLRDLTLRNGLAQGGEGQAGGAGAGMGGAIFNQGQLVLSRVTLNGNVARGGDSGVFDVVFGGVLYSGVGAGMGRDARDGGGFGPGQFGGAFGGSVLFDEAGALSKYGCGGGAGFGVASGGDAVMGSIESSGGVTLPTVIAGEGGGLGRVGGAFFCSDSPVCAGEGDGGAGGVGLVDSNPGDGRGGSFGLNGSTAAGCGGGGGVGAGGAPGSAIEGFKGGAGGFGGGGAAGAAFVGTGGTLAATLGGSGGFGGGGGSSWEPESGGNLPPPGLGGFGGGNGGFAFEFASGGGGAGMGGALFNYGGNVTASNTTWTDNHAIGGSVQERNIASPGAGYGGAIFNLDGILDIAYSTLSGNRVVRGAASTPALPNPAGGAIYNRLQNPGVYGFRSELVIRTSILANSLDGDGLPISDCNVSLHPDVELNAVTLITGLSVFENLAIVDDLDGNDHLACTLTFGSILGAPQLLPLADNGGLTPTMAIGAGSPAIDFAGNCADPSTDQRGVARPQGAGCDAGAFELEIADFGDAPAPYPTLLADDGARHLVSSLFLGACVDAETNGQPSAGADADDLATGSPTTGACAVPGDDEDGVVFNSVIRAGETTSLDVIASVDGLLDAWLDFNADGVWEAGEQIFADQPLVAGANALVIAVPPDALPGETFARFRFSSDGGSAPTGLAADGEVEDYALSIEPLLLTVGGTVSGLAGSGLVLQNNGGDDLAIDVDGNFEFPPQDDGTGYEVTVLTQPGNPSQACSVTGGAGTLSGSNVSNVLVECVTGRFTVGGTVSALAGSGLVLQNNGGDDLTIASDGSFTFSTALEDLSGYDVTVLTQPTGPIQTCVTVNGSGNLAGADLTDVLVDCVTELPEVGLSAGALDFGIVLDGDASAGSVTITNTGTGELIIDELVEPGPPFAVAGGSCTALPVTLQPGGSCAVEIVFAPSSSSGGFSDELGIISNAASSPDAVTLTGGTRPVLIPALDRFGLLLLTLLIAGFAWRVGRPSAG